MPLPIYRILCGLVIWFSHLYRGQQQKPQQIYRYGQKHYEKVKNNNSNNNNNHHHHPLRIKSWSLSHRNANQRAVGDQINRYYLNYIDNSIPFRIIFVFGSTVKIWKQTHCLRYDIKIFRLWASIAPVPTLLNWSGILNKHICNFPVYLSAGNPFYPCVTLWPLKSWGRNDQFWCKNHPNRISDSGVTTVNIIIFNANGFVTK